MNIRNYKELKRFALERLENAPGNRPISLIYAAVIIGMSVLMALADHLLGLQIDQSGGLRNMGIRTVLSTLQTMLPMVQSAVFMCLDLGYVAAMLRIARGQYTSPNTLRLGFARFWVMLRFSILESLILIGMGTVSCYFGMLLFLMTPLADPVEEMVLPLISQTSLLQSSIVIPDALYDQLMEAMLPGMILCGIFYAAIALPVLYRLRMTAYVIIDRPGIGAMAAMAQSKIMMRGNRLSLFKMDLSFWWFFLARIAASVICYGDRILPALGVKLPFSEDVGFFLFYGIYWVLEFLIIYFLRARMDVAYGLAYDAVRPKDTPQNGVVLGNIFQM